MEIDKKKMLTEKMSKNIPFKIALNRIVNNRLNNYLPTVMARMRLLDTFSSRRAFG